MIRVAPATPSAVTLLLAEPLIRSIAWNVRVAADYVPGASCLTQALAAQHLLSHAGLFSTLRIGVAKNTEGGVSAHAWLDSMGIVVTGGNTATQFAEFPVAPPPGNSAASSG